MYGALGNPLMESQVQPLSADRRGEALDLMARSFAATPRAYFAAHQERDPAWDVSQSLVLEANGALVGHLWIAERVMRYGLGRVRTGCLADVCVDPAHEGQGYAGRLLDAAIARMDANGQPLSLLSTNKPEVYAGRGWRAVPTSRLEAELPRGYVESAGGRVVRPFEPRDLRAVELAYAELAADRVGPLDRSEAYWLAMCDWLPLVDPGCEVHFDVLQQVGSVVGYAITRLSGSGVTILDAGIESESMALPFVSVWRDRAARRGVRRLTGELHPRSELFDLLRKRLRARLEPEQRFMVRLNSLRGALEAAAPELIRRRRRAAPLPGPSFVLRVDGEAVRVETPLANVVFAAPQGGEPVVELTSQQFLDLYLGLEGGFAALRDAGAPPHVDVYLRRLFPDSPFSYWLADKF